MLTIITPATATRLTTVARVREEFPSITVDLASDGQVERWIDRASAMAVRYCNRPFAQDVVRQVEFAGGESRILLERTPATDLAVTLDGAALVLGTDYHHDAKRGALYRLTGGRPGVWAGMVQIDYKGGYVVPGEFDATLPGDVEYAVQLWVASFAVSMPSVTSSGTIKRESILNGLVDITYADAAGTGGAAAQAQPEIADLLAPYRIISL